MEDNTNVKVTYNPTGSGSGIKAVQEGRCDIGLSSRDLKDDEKADLEGTFVAIDGIAIIVNPANKIDDLRVAIKDGTGKSERYSDTLMQKTLYYALGLDDGADFACGGDTKFGYYNFAGTGTADYPDYCNSSRNFDVFVGAAIKIYHKAYR